MMERRKQTNIEKKNKQMLQNDSFSFLIPINSHKMQEKQRWKNTPISITSPKNGEREKKKTNDTFLIPINSHKMARKARIKPPILPQYKFPENNGRRKQKIKKSSKTILPS